MNTHPGNGRQADGEKLRLALEELEEEEEVGSRHEPLKNEPLKSSYEAAIARIAEKGWGPKHEEVPIEQAKPPIETPVVETSSLETLVDSAPQKEDDHVIEWESPIKATPANTETPLAEALSGSAPAVAIGTTTRENPFTKERVETKKIFEEVSDKFSKGTATSDELRKASLNAREKILAEKKWDKENEVTPEGRIMETINKKLASMQKEVLERAQKSGEYTLGKTRDVGEWYKKQPLSKKLLVSVGLLGLASGAAAIGGAAGAGIATAAFTGSAIQRTLGGAATFLAVEGLLKKSYQKNGIDERTNKQKVFHAGEALALAIVMGGFLGQAASNIYDGVSETWGTVTPDADSKPDALKIKAAVEKAVTASEFAPSPMLYTEYVVPQGGSVWAGLSEKLGHQPSFEKLSEGQKSYVIDTLKNKLSAMSDADLKTMGISSGNIDKVGAGDKINFDKILSNTKLIEAATDHARTLSLEQIHNIETNHTVSTSGEVGPTPARIIPEEPLESTPTPAEVIPDTTIPQNFTPASPEDLAEANRTVRVDLDRVLGKSGSFLGFGGTHGIDTPHWKDPQFGFANKTMDEVMNAAGRPNGLLPGGGKIGIENYQKVVDVQKYLTDVKTYSTLTPMSGEKVADYIKRAAIALLQQQKS